MAPVNTGGGEYVKIRPGGETIYVSRGRTVFACQPDGRVNAEHAIEGLYIYDTRILSRYCWSMNGKQPEFSCASKIEQFSWMGYYVQAPENCKETPAQECDPLQQTLEFRLTRTVGEGMHEDVLLINHTQIAATVKLELKFDHPFIARKEAEGGRKQHGKMVSRWTEPEPNVWERMTQYHAQHHYDHQGNVGTAEMRRGVKLRIENATSPPARRNKRIAFDASLAPHGEWHACLSWIGYVEGQQLPLTTACTQANSSDWEQGRVQFLNSAAAVSVAQSGGLACAVARLLHRSRLDLADLRLYDQDTPAGIAIAAGVPTYMEIFGRDMEVSSWQATMLNHQLLRGTLNVLGDHQATEKNDWRDAQPGRIPHEIHTDPLSVLNFRPKSLYFGSVSGCFLFPVCVAELWRWTGDLDAVRKFVDVAMRAIQWSDTYSLDSTNFYRYKTRSEQGEKNQGWKDSNDAIVYPDGSQVEAPIGTCEMQAFVYLGKLRFSEVMWRLGHMDAARRLYRQAQDLKARFSEKFWMDQEGFLAMGIGPQGELIRSIAGDPGHCLLTGIVDDQQAQRIAIRMLRDDMFSGWGIRTLSADHPAYNPFSYHRGSVWPVTNANFVMGFASHGLYAEMQQLAKAMFEAAALFEHDRLPEVFAGHQRTAQTPFPGLYTRADWPQAWSASAPFSMMQALLGICPYAPAELLLLDPHLPEWLPEITVERLQVGKAAVSLKFSRTSEGNTDYEIVDQKGPLHVVHQPRPWSHLSGWAQQIRDVTESLAPHGHSTAR